MRTGLLYGAIALAAAAYLFAFVRVLSGAPDEGIYLYDAQRVLEGAIPGRDFLQENAPGAYYWLALFFRLFGTNLITARTLLLLTGVGTALLIFHLARRVGSTGIGVSLFVLITSIPLQPINSPHYDSNFFALGSFTVFLVALDRLNTGRFAGWLFLVAGALAGWTSCILQQKGALFLFAFLLSTLWLHRKQGNKACVYLVCGFACVLALELIPYIYWGALKDLFVSTVKAPLTGYHAENHVPYGFPLWSLWFPAMFAQLRANSSLILAVPMLMATSLPFLLMVSVSLFVGLLGFVWRSRLFVPALVPYWITGYAMWLSELHRQDLSHLRHGCKILVLLFFLICERYGTRISKRLALGMMLGTLLMGLTALNGALSAKEPIVTRRGTLFAQRQDPVLAFLLAHTHPGEYVFVHPYSPVYYFLADLRNPTKLSTIVDQRDNPNIRDALKGLEAHQPRYAVEDTRLLGEGMRTMFPGFQPPPPSGRMIDVYLDTHYHPVAMANSFRILERNQPPSKPTTPEGG
jgi:hypothetical protein